MNGQDPITPKWVRGNEPAFPNDQQGTYPGLTKREWFAGMAMMGLLSNRDNTVTYAMIAEDAWKQADAMLKEGEK